jgi:hypothetical protein
VEEVSVLFFRHRDPFEHEHECAAGGADVDRLIGSVENEDGCVERSPAFNVDLGNSLADAVELHASGGRCLCPLALAFAFVPWFRHKDQP